MDERLQRTAAAVREAGADWAVLTSSDAVTYASGHVVPIETGQSPFNGGPTTAFVSRDGVCGVVCTNLESAAAKSSWAQSEIYTTFQFTENQELGAQYVAAVQALARRLGIAGRLAVEQVPDAARVLGGLDRPATTDITPFLRAARATKTTAELMALKRCADAAAVGQQAFYASARAGRTELDIFADIRAAIENFAGERCAMAGDFVSGRDRTAAAGGWPISRTVLAGDPIISDLAPRIAGYWGDSCASAVLGEGDDRYLSLHHAARSALELAVSLIRPGVRVDVLDAQLRAHVASFGYAFAHHAGHGIGTGVHEWPRIVPYETAQLREGMVLMIEPGAYVPGIGGVRCEWMIEVTATGSRPVSPFPIVPSI